MKFLPYEKYTRPTSLSFDETMNRVVNHLKTNSFRFSAEGADKENQHSGRVTQNTFEQNRMIRFGKADVFAAYGVVSTQNNKTIINVTVRQPQLQSVFITIWFSITFLFCIPIVMIIIWDGFKPVLLVPFIMFAFGYLPMMIRFNRERKFDKEVFG